MDLAHVYREAEPLYPFATGTIAALAPYGFNADNTLSIVGVCRDELMFSAEHALHDVWGAAFDMSSLAGMVLLGRSGLAAAAHHAPGDDGRRRFVIVVMPHIGLLADGTVGHVLREGQDVPSTACGALVGLLAQMRAGQFTNALDWDDVEMSVVATILGRRLDHADGAAALDLWTLTDLARQTASAEIMRLAHELLEDEDTDVALFSGVLIHGPDGDRVHLAEASLWRGAERAPVALSLP